MPPPSLQASQRMTKMLSWQVLSSSTIFLWQNKYVHIIIHSKRDNEAMGTCPLYFKVGDLKFLRTLLRL